ncbi:MAG: phenylalanine--tRNA ligase subunit beta [Acidobacteria bacterium]|nr:phenylalanine--tRNA ligase subunit beta [Acidobacteriota bacterium]
MRVPLTWLRDYVAIVDTPDELASRLTFAGLEVEEIEYVGLAPEQRPIAGLPATGRSGPPAVGIAWNPATIVIAQVLEVMPHPNADRLTLLRVDDGTGTEQIVLTGAPNLFPLKGTGPLATPMKVVYAREGAVLYDGHKPGREVMTLKRAKIRGVESKSMVCSEKELGISDEHDGIIVLDADAPVGMPAAAYMGDVVFTVKINPNMARNACIVGIAREIAALTDVPLITPATTVAATGAPLAGRVDVEIRDAALNPRFALGLIEGVAIAPSPYRVQRRLRLAGTRPINNIVDATNYVMFELGEPLHAFDWDVIRKRAGDTRPTIITRRAAPGETLTTLDHVGRTLDQDAVLVCDAAGPLSLAGVMGGAESEISASSTNILLEGAAWDFINIRKTVKAQGLPSEASYRFSRGVHAALAEWGVNRALGLMREWAGGSVAAGLVDRYPGKVDPPVVAITPADVERQLGVRMEIDQIVRILGALEFRCEVVEGTVRATAPEHRLDIGQGITGQADIVEELARIYGYERIPNTMLAEVIPPPHPNRELIIEERVRDLLVSLGLQEIVTYSLTSPEREARLAANSEPGEEPPYVRLANPIVVDRVVMRRTLLSGLLEIAAANARHADRLAFFEVGPVFLSRPDRVLPEEPVRIAMLLAGPRAMPGWQGADREPMDFYDLKGVIEGLAQAMQVPAISVEPAAHPSLIPGRSAKLLIGAEPAGHFGELHPAVAGRFGITGQRVLIAELDLATLTADVTDRHASRAVPTFPPVREDIAVIVSDEIPAAKVCAVVRAAGGPMLSGMALFDVYRGGQVGPGNKSLALSLTYQASDRTLTDVDAAKIRERIVRALQTELGATLRG